MPNNPRKLGPQRHWFLIEKRDLVVSLVKTNPLLMLIYSLLSATKLMLPLTFQETLGATQPNPGSLQLGQIDPESGGLRPRAVSSRLGA